MMKTKIVTISLIVIGLSNIACRQTDEMLIENEEQQLLQLNEKPQVASKNLQNNNTRLIGNDTRLSIYNSEPININLSSTDNKDCSNSKPKEPPRDGSHWIVSNNDDCPKQPPKDGSHWRNGN